MAYEDFTTFTEVDPNNHITVDSATQITMDDIRRNEDAYVYKDYGAAHFGDYDHDFACQGTGVDNTAIGAAWGVANSIDDVRGNGGISVRMTFIPAAGIYIALADRTELTNDSWNGGTAGTWYYCTSERSGVAATCKIYTDAARTVLVDTLSIVCQNTTLRYLYGTSSWNTGHNIDFDGVAKELDINEAAAETHNPSDTAKASDSLAFDARPTLTDTAKASDSLLKSASSILSDIAKAIDAVSFSGTGIGDAFKYPLKIIKDKFYKYKAEREDALKYKIRKDKSGKYYVEKDD